jgi:hypothetical protein
LEISLSVLFAQGHHSRGRLDNPIEQDIVSTISSTSTTQCSFDKEDDDSEYFTENDEDSSYCESEPSIVLSQKNNTGTIGRMHAADATDEASVADEDIRACFQDCEGSEDDMRFTTR